MCSKKLEEQIREMLVQAHLLMIHPLEGLIQEILALQLMETQELICFLQRCAEKRCEGMLGSKEDGGEHELGYGCSHNVHKAEVDNGTKEALQMLLHDMENYGENPNAEPSRGPFHSMN